MNLAMPSKALAYVYGGDWVADCPRDGCGNVEHLFDRSNPKVSTSLRTVRKTAFFCSYCRIVTDINWPNNEAGIIAVLRLRPIPHTRNWYPKDHPTAVRFGVEHGQSVDELKAENEAHGVSV